MSFDSLWQDNNFRHDHSIPGGFCEDESFYTLSQVKRIALLFYQHGVAEIHAYNVATSPVFSRKEGVEDEA